MLELVRTLLDLVSPDKLDQMVADHTPDKAGRCPLCRTTPGCTLHTAARSAAYLSRAGRRPTPTQKQR